MADWPYNIARWRRFRLLQLAREPMCGPCFEDTGRVMPATDVDHVTPISKGGAIWDLGNMQSLCHAHHSIKTNCDMKGQSFEAWRRRGCDELGNPRDPAHPWHPSGDESLQPDGQGPAAALQKRLVR